MNKDQVKQEKNLGVPSTESAIIPKLDAAPPDVSDDPLNSILLLLYELTIANAPFPPADCRDLADRIALHVGTARATLTKWKDRVNAFQEGYKDKSFEVTALEIQLMDLRAHGVDKVTARQNESLRVRLHATSIERNELRAISSALADALTDLVHQLPTDERLADYNLDRAEAALALARGDETGRETETTTVG